MKILNFIFKQSEKPVKHLEFVIENQKKAFSKEYLKSLQKKNTVSVTYEQISQ
jgi:hypothetical protein